MLEHIKIDNTDVFLEPHEEGKGKITISDTYGHNYSYFWGAMGQPLKDFIKSIDAGYFTKNMIGAKDMYTMDVKRTFTAVRKHIREEILPWWMYLEFQKDMREVLNSFQRECEDIQNDRHFVDHFHITFIKGLDFSLIEDKWDRNTIEQEFNSIDEPWGFIERKTTDEYRWLVKFHSKLKKQLK